MGRSSILPDLNNIVVCIFSSNLNVFHFKRFEFLQQDFPFIMKRVHVGVEKIYFNK